MRDLTLAQRAHLNAATKAQHDTTIHQYQFLTADGKQVIRSMTRSEFHRQMAKRG